MATATPSVLSRLARRECNCALTDTEADALLALLDEIATQVDMIPRLIADHPELETQLRAGAWCDVAARYAELVELTR